MKVTKKYLQKLKIMMSYKNKNQYKLIKMKYYKCSKCHSVNNANPNNRTINSNNSINNITKTTIKIQHLIKEKLGELIL